MSSKFSDQIESNAVKTSLFFKGLYLESDGENEAYHDAMYRYAHDMVQKFKKIQKTPISTDNVWAAPFLEIDPLAAKSRSFDSVLGTYIEGIAHNIIKLNFSSFSRRINGWISKDQHNLINELMDKYYSSGNPQVSDYLDNIHPTPEGEDTRTFSHTVDLYFQDGTDHYVCELKLGGNLDIKKAQGEKLALLQEYCALKNKYPNDNVHIILGTLYSPSNMNQFSRVKKFFAKDELKIGQEFWNFICRSNSGYHDLLHSWNEIIKTELL